MIVNYKEEGWSIVLQRSHGLLAGQICGHWKKSDQPVRWVETLIATTEHDDVSNELEGTDLLNENGGPKNFKTAQFNATDCDNLLAKATEKGMYVALLISRHIQFLYQQEPRADAYCMTLKQKEKQWIKQAETSPEQVSASYELLEFCDAMSLLICQNMVQPEHRRMEISTGPDGTHYELREGEDQRLIVSPWPFEVDSFTINYETRNLSQLSFKSNAEFTKLLKSADVQLLSRQISRK
ncbi:DUF3891 family protein [Dyadobacter sp. CY323]|uniref:DUF3891 family protein n=1 Tax=Dyadobacter sp. CY323 TaxID=2907302 RepID=UPI001F297028|nr:DUF3891 family protein [Dyadobacter sp. CY323]MCE6991958.1 DUF3891 family protein [Dyadobacter sp. CY323]